MADSSTEIANMALRHLGVSKEIASLTEASAEARACNRWYEHARDICLRAGAWGFARKTADLGLVDSDPTEEWAYAYTYPSDCLNIRRIVNGTRHAAPDERDVYELAKGDASTVIYTDVEEAVIEYTMRMEDVERYPFDFVEALSYKLAELIAPSVVSNNSAWTLKREMQAFYQAALGRAIAANENEQEHDPEPKSDLERERE